jgi:hypothetical protein
MEARLRALMTDFGMTETAKQDALIAFIAEDEVGKATVREAGRRLLIALRRDTTPERMRDMIAVYKGAIDADRERRAAAQTALNAKIGYSLDPRLEATLWLFGLLGDGHANLPLGALAAGRSAAKATPRGADQSNDLYGNFFNAPPTFVVFGTVENKGPGWVEVREPGGKLDRYVLGPAADAAERARNPLVDVLPAIRIADFVRLEYLNNSKRLLRIELWQGPVPQATLQTEPEARLKAAEDPQENPN